MSAVHTAYSEMSHALLVDEALCLRARIAELERKTIKLREALTELSYIMLDPGY